MLNNHPDNKKENIDFNEFQGFQEIYVYTIIETIEE